MALYLDLSSRKGYNYIMTYLEFTKAKKLLNIDNNAKTVKGQKDGYMTAILYQELVINRGSILVPWLVRVARKLVYICGTWSI